MTKRISTDSITSELAEGSVFFSPQEREEPVQDDQPVPVPVPPRRRADRASNGASTRDSDGAMGLDSDRDSSGDSKLDSYQARLQARNHASLSARSLTQALTSNDDLADAIFRVVKKPGKDIAYVRMTEREKVQVASTLADIVQTYGYKVSETELIRIAVCALLADYATAGDDSMLMRVVEALKE